MSPVFGLVLILATIVVAVIISQKYKVDFGFFTMLCAFAYGYVFLNLNSSQILAYFPTRIMMTFVVFTMFFGFVSRSGVFNAVADRVLYAFRNRPALIPFAIFLACGMISSFFGGGVYAAFAIMAPIAFALAKQVGFSPILAVLALWAGAGGGISFPWGSGVAMFNGVFENSFIGASEQTVNSVYPLLCLSLTLTITTGFIVLYFIFKGYKIDKKSINVKKPEPMTEFQRKVFTVVLVFLALLVIPQVIQTVYANPVTAWMVAKLDIFTLFIFGTLILAAMNIENINTVVKEDVPWSVILMVTGTTMLISLMKDFGVFELLISFLSENAISAYWVIPISMLIGAVLTLFTNGLTVLMSLAPILYTISEAIPGVPAVGLFIATYIATQGPSISPFSTGGAMALMACPADIDKDKLIKQQLGCAIFMSAWTILFGLLGWYSWMSF